MARLHAALTARCSWTSGSSRVMHSAISLRARPNVTSTEGSRGFISRTWSHLSIALEYSLIASYKAPNVYSIVESINMV